MIFKQHFIDMILSGTKTQTRRPNRSYYKVGHSYSIQPCRTCKAIAGVRILIYDIYEEMEFYWFAYNFFDKSETTRLMPITQPNAEAEGCRSPFLFEKAFRELYPKWDGKSRWVYKFNAAIRTGGEEKK